MAAIWKIREFLTLLLVMQWSRSCTSIFIPSEVKIALITESKDDFEIKVMKYAVEKINEESVISPNTTLKALDVSLNADNAFTTTKSLMESDVVALFESRETSSSSQIAANLLNAPIFKLHQDVCDELYQTHYDGTCENSIILHQSLQTVNDAVVRFLNVSNISSIVIIYDVLRSKQLGNFLDSNNNTIKKYHLLHLKLGEDEQVSSNSLKELQALRTLNISTVLLFVDIAKMELVMDIVNLHCSCITGRESLLWILPIVPYWEARWKPKPLASNIWLQKEKNDRSSLNFENSTIYNANPFDKVVGFKLRLKKSRDFFNLLHFMEQHEVSTGEPPESALLLFDAVMATANAIRNIISRGEWEARNASTIDGSFASEGGNAGKVKKEIRSVSISGMTGTFSIGANGKRNVTELDILNLKKDQFFKIGSYSTANGVLLKERVEQNRKLSSIRITHKTLKVVAVKQIPFVFVKKTGNKTVFSGFSYDLLKTLSTLLKFDFEIHLSKTQSLINDLKTMNADMILNPMVISAGHQVEVSFTKPFMHFSIGLLAKKKENNEPRYDEFMLPFTYSAWCVVLSSSVFVMLVVYVIDKYSPYGWRQTQQAQGEEGDEFSLFNSWWFWIACMLTQGADNTPKNLSGRIVTACFWFCVLVWNATYTANLASFLVLKNDELPVTSIRDAMTKEYKVIILKDSEVSHVIKISDSSLMKELWSKAKKEGNFVTKHEDGVAKVKKIEEVAFIDEEPILKYYKGQKECNLAMVPNVLQPMSYAFALPLSSKYTDSMSVGILQLQEKGIVESYERKWWLYQDHCPDLKQSVSQSSLGVAEMKGVYSALIFGIIISTIAVSMEIWWEKCLGRTLRKLMTKRKRIFSFQPSS